LPPALTWTASHHPPPPPPHPTPSPRPTEHAASPQSLLEAKGSGRGDTSASTIQVPPPLLRSPATPGSAFSAAPTGLGVLPGGVLPVALRPSLALSDAVHPGERRSISTPMCRHAPGDPRPTHPPCRATPIAAPRMYACTCTCQASPPRHMRARTQAPGSLPPAATWQPSPHACMREHAPAGDSAPRTRYAAPRP
jgi:hypothetical protein